MQRLVFLFLLSFGHLVTDMMSGALPVLLPVLKSEFSLSYTQLGVIILVSNLISSVIQPVFGIWSDRKAILWLLPIGCFVAALGMAFVGLAPTYIFVLIAVALSGIGAAAYHPEGSKQAFLISGERKATALSIYSVGGNIGHALGPMIAVMLLGFGGRQGMAWLLIIGIIAAFLLGHYLPAIQRFADHNNHVSKADTQVSQNVVKKGVLYGLFLLMMIIIMRSLVHIGLTNFIPLYVEEYLHGSKEYGGLLLTVFLLSGALGTIVGGPVADWIGRKKVMVLSFLLVVPLLWMFLFSSGIWTLLFAGLSGFVLISTFSVTVVYAQELIPHNVGLASGLTLGFAFGIGAIGGLVFGVAADVWGIPAVLKVICLLPIPALLLSIALPDERKRESTA
ncbi:MAG: MFS transporter [Syntrophaceticus sp.]|nr:MFS transporter [Syntrophaceticus sp.]MDD3314404.1 MFS transporter [Syntrophaceticus sp.]MDD4782733.1 MFS transporter [Syntrophaceticus sp.]